MLIQRTQVQFQRPTYQLTNTYNSSSNRSDALLWPVWHCIHVVHLHAGRTAIHIIFKIKNK